MMRLRVYGALLVTALGMYWVGQCHGLASAADLLVVQNAQTALALGPPYRARLDSLRRLEQQQSVLAGAWRHRADSLRTRALRVDTVTLVAASDSSAVSLWRATANAEHETARICRGVLQTCQERAQAAMNRAARLDSLLGNVLKVKDCKILFVRCPSRTAMFLVGSGLGFAGGLLISR